MFVLNISKNCCTGDRIPTRRDSFDFVLCSNLWVSVSAIEHCQLAVLLASCTTEDAGGKGRGPAASDGENGGRGREQRIKEYRKEKKSKGGHAQVVESIKSPQEF